MQEFGRLLKNKLRTKLSKQLESGPTRDKILAEQEALALEGTGRAPGTLPPRFFSDAQVAPGSLPATPAVENPLFANISKSLYQRLLPHTTYEGLTNGSIAPSAITFDPSNMSQGFRTELQKRQGFAPGSGNFGVIQNPELIHRIMMKRRLAPSVGGNVSNVPLSQLLEQLRESGDGEKLFSHINPLDSQEMQRKYATGYKKGGPVNIKLSKTLERARKMGQREDKVLAHINPEEAEELRQKYGGDINPHTGLPQFGKRRGIGRFLGNVARVVLPVVGHMIAGPAGAAIGGGLGRAAASRGNMGKNFLKGAGNAAALSSLASFAGGPMNSQFLQGGHGFMGFQGPQQGFAGKIFGRGDGSITNALNNFGSSAWNGISGFGSSMMPGGASASGVAQMAQPAAMQNVPHGTGYSAGDQQQQQQQSPGFFQQMVNSVGGPVPAALTAASLLALTKKKDKVIEPPKETYHNPFPGELGGPAKRAKPLNRRLKTPHELAHETDEHPGVWFDNVNPETELYAEGGPVRGHGGGTADNINTGVKDHTFIWDATDVSLLGDGNTENGFHKLGEFEKQLLNSKYAVLAKHSVPRSPQDVKIRISSGEYRMDPLAVAALGHMKGGDINTGIKAIKDIRNNLKAQKGLTAKKIPPKSKPIMQYMRG